MSSYDGLYKILDKGIISISELKSLPGNEHVSIVEQKPSKKHGYNKYDVTLDSGELYFVYVKQI